MFNTLHIRVCDAVLHHNELDTKDLGVNRGLFLGYPFNQSHFAEDQEVST